MTWSISTVDGVGTVRAHYVIAADGMWSPVRKALGVNQPGYLGEWHAFRQYVGDVTGPAADRLYVWFEADLLPGYAWSFPLPGNRANVGFGVLREQSRRTGDMKDLWTDLLAAPAHRGRPRAGLRARGPAHGVADPRPRRRRDAQPRPHVVRRRRRGGDRRDDRRRDRTGTAHRPAGGRGDPGGRDARPGDGTRRVRVGRPPPPVRRPRDVAGARQGAAPTVRRVARSASSARAGGGGGATSPAGCSRTNRGRSCSHRVAGTAGSSPDRAPTAADRAWSARATRPWTPEADPCARAVES